MKYSQFSGADRFGPCRLHADIYEPIVNYLGIAGGIVKRGERHRPGVAMPPDMRMDGHAPARGCKVILQPTLDAIHLFNSSQAKKVGLFHVTC